MNKESVLEVQNLSKSFGAIQAVKNLTLSVEPGSVYGLLGPNGSGKSTTLGIILGTVHASSGSYNWFGGSDSVLARRKIGAMLEKPNFLPKASGLNNLKIAANVKGVSHDRIPPVLEKVGLMERAKSPFRTYSLGMKQRLAIASVLLSDPEVLVLDEPTNGLDPSGIYEIRELIQELAAGNRTIILASHILDEVEKVCTHVGILKRGELIRSGSIDMVLSGGDIIQVAARDMEKLAELLSGIPEIRNIKQKRDFFSAVVEQDYDMAQLSKLMVDRQLPPTHLVKVRQRLEDSFIEAVGGNQ